MPRKKQDAEAVAIEKMETAKEVKPEPAKKPKKTAKEKEKEILSKRNGVASSNSKLPEGMEVIVPTSPSFTGRKFRPNLKSLDPNGVIFIDGSAKYKQQQSPKELAYQRLKSSLDPRVQTMFTGIVKGKRDIASKDGEVISYALVSTNAGVEGYTGRTIMISYSDFYVPNGTKNSLHLSPDKYIDSMMGAEVDFTILEMLTDENGNEKYIIGSRRRASLRKIATYWEGKQDDKYLLDVGNIVEARIVNVAPKGIRVELFGIEFFVPGKELSYGAISNCQGKFFVGDKIQVKITELIRTQKGEIYAQLSHRETKPNELLDFMGDYAVGDEVEGLTSNVTFDEKKNETVVFVTLDGTMDVLCKMMPNVSVVPIVGEKVKLRIMGMDEEKMQMWGGILHVYVKY